MPPTTFRLLGKSCMRGGCHGSGDVVHNIHDPKVRELTLHQVDDLFCFCGREFPQQMRSHQLVQYIGWYFPKRNAQNSEGVFVSSGLENDSKCILIRSEFSGASLYLKYDPIRYTYSDVAEEPPYI